MSVLVGTARGLFLATQDLLNVGLWHPGLLAWRLEESLRHTLISRRKDAFDAHLRSRVEGQPQLAFAQGNTPWTVLADMVEWLNLRRDGVFVDVGAGDGMAAAVLCALTGARGYAVEPIAPLRTRAYAAMKALRLDVTVLEHLEEVPVSAVTAALSAWTCVDAAAQRVMTQALCAMRKGSRVVTVTHPVSDERFSRLATHARLFPWGRNEVHVHERV